MNVRWQLGSLKQESVFKNTPLYTISDLPCRSKDKALLLLVIHYSESYSTTGEIWWCRNRLHESALPV